MNGIVMITRDIILLLTGLLIFGEATALLIGTGLIVKPRPQWLSQKNFAFLADDLFFGIVLILLAFDILTAPWIFWLSIISTFLSHAWRDAEFVAKFPNPFCGNTALFLLNNLKLMGLVSSIML
jgi:hypothetical protein